MGRHSAPDDEDEVPSAIAVVDLPDEDTDRGRHARGDAEDHESDPSAAGSAVAEAATTQLPVAPDSAADQAIPERLTQQLPVIDAPLDAAPAGGSVDAAPAGGSVDAAPAGGSVDAAPAGGPARHATGADVMLIREHADVQARVAAAVIVPFVVDVVVLLVLGDFTLRRFLIWIWAPLILAGVLIGLVLDAGDRRHRQPVPPSVPPSG